MFLSKILQFTSDSKQPIRKFHRDTTNKSPFQFKNSTARFGCYIINLKLKISLKYSNVDYILIFESRRYKFNFWNFGFLNNEDINYNFWKFYYCNWHHILYEFGKSPLENQNALRCFPPNCFCHVFHGCEHSCCTDGSFWIRLIFAQEVRFKFKMCVCFWMDQTHSVPPHWHLTSASRVMGRYESSYFSAIVPSGGMGLYLTRGCAPATGMDRVPLTSHEAAMFHATSPRHVFKKIADFEKIVQICTDLCIVDDLTWNFCADTLKFRDNSARNVFESVDCDLCRGGVCSGGVFVWLTEFSCFSSFLNKKSRFE